VAEDEQEIVVETMQSPSGIRGGLDYKMIVMRQIDRCGFALSKLPHEITVQGYNEPAGCLYSDIQKSFYDAVMLLEALVAPYADKEFQEERKKLVDAEAKISDDGELHKNFFERYSCVITLCARLGMLLENVGDEGI